MAIIDSLPGVRVCIVVAGKSLREYQDHDEPDEPGNVTRYVKATTGAAFEIHVWVPIGFKADGEGLDVKFVVNGDTTDEDIVVWRDCQKKEYPSISEGVALPGSRVRKYAFSSLETVSDGRKMPTEASLVKHLGSIQVRVCGIKNISYVTKARRQKHRGASLRDTGFVSEKALKGQAISHSVALATRASKAVSAPIGEYDFDALNIDSAGAPIAIATYTFRYRSLQALKSMMIIPRTPSPPPLEERDFGDLTREDIIELQKRAKAAKGTETADVKVKRERGDDNPRPRKIHRPAAGDTQLEIDGDGSFRESSTASVPRREPEVIVLD